MANTQTSVNLFGSGTVLTAAQMNQSAATGTPVFANTTTRDAAFGGANKVLAEGQTCYLEDSNIVQYYDGAAWASVSVSSTTAIFNETQASGTDGGTATSGSYIKRTLNTTVINNIASCTLAASVISLPAGTYSVESSAPIFGSDNTKTRIQNTTDSATIQIGSSERSGGGDSTQTRSFVNGYFTLAGTKDIELQSRCSTTKATYGLGVASSFGDSEVYATITITKVA